MHWIVFFVGLLCAAMGLVLALFQSLGAAAPFFGLCAACCIAAYLLDIADEQAARERLQRVIDFDAFERWDKQR